jgi:competence protein ComEC
MNYRSVPFLRFVVPFLIGIAWAAHRDQAVQGLGLALALGLLLALALAGMRYAYRYRWVYGAFLALMLLGGGYYRTASHNELRQPGHFAQHLGDAAQYVLGTVYEAPSRGSKLKIPLRVEAIGPGPDSLRGATGNLLLFLDIGSGADSLRYGDRVGLRATLRATEPPKNPDAFNYKRYLHFQNIHYQAFVKPDALLLLQRDQGWALWRLAYGCREKLLALLRKHFPTQDEYAVASALLVGYKDDLSEDMRTAYAETGSMHALAVSGTHVGMLYVGLMFLLQRLRLGGRWRWVEMAILLAAIWAFTFLTGATASVLRASVMFSTYLVGKALRREASAWNVLPASAFLLLAYNPYFLFDAGFQLSYTAVMGMVFFYPRLYKMFPPGPRWADEGLKVLLVGVAAQLGTLPLTLLYFNQFPVYFWLAGWIVVLGGAIFLWGGAVLVLLDAVSGLLADGLGTALYYMVWGMNQLILLIQRLPGSVVPAVWMPPWAALLLYVAVGMLGAFMVWRKARWLAGFLACMILLGLYRNLSLAQKHQQRRCVAYYVARHRAVDFFDGPQLYTLSDTLLPRQLAFAAQGHRTASGLRGQQQYFFGAETGIQAPNLWVEPPFAQFFELRMAFIDSTHWVRAGTPDPVAVDVVFLSHSPPLRIAECQRRFPAPLYVFDGSNDPRQVARWRKECLAEGWAFHDMRSQGAWAWSAKTR